MFTIWDLQNGSIGDFTRLKILKLFPNLQMFGRNRDKIQSYANS